MSLLRGPGLERKVGRRTAKKAQLFKENQVLIGTESTKKPHRRKKNDRHVAVELPEFQLLVKLYVPANLLIKNNQVSVRQLTAYLPELVDGRFAELNFELHIFLGSLVTAYVLSWYEKLNTENTAFVYDVYETLCVFVKDVSSRILGIVELPRLLDLTNQLAQILDHHLRDNMVENGVPRYAQLFRQRCSHNILEENDLHGLRNRYLRENHIMFDSQWALRAVELGSSGEMSTLTSVDMEKSIISPGPTYLKVLVKRILQTAFSEDNLAVQGPRLSVIVSNFLTVLLADLVLGKIVTKLSLPEFLISTVMGGLSNKLTRKHTEEKLPGHKITLSLRFQNIKVCCEKVFYNVSSASIAFRKYLWNPEQNPTIFFSPVMSLLDVITNFSARKPVLVSLMKSARSIIFSIGDLGPKLDNFVGAFLLERTSRSVIADDATLAHVIEILRSSLFDKTIDTGSQPLPQKSVAEVRDDIFEMVSSQMKALPISLLWFEYAGENEEDIRKSIEDFLLVFDLESPAQRTGLQEKKSDMNLLLVIKLLDCVVQNIYPEMTTEVSNVA